MTLLINIQLKSKCYYSSFAIFALIGEVIKGLL